MRVILGEFQHVEVVAVIVKNKIRKAEIKTHIERRKVHFLKDEIKKHLEKMGRG